MSRKKVKEGMNCGFLSVRQIQLFPRFFVGKFVRLKNFLSHLSHSQQLRSSRLSCSSSRFRHFSIFSCSRPDFNFCGSFIGPFILLSFHTRQHQKIMISKCNGWKKLLSCARVGFVRMLCHAYLLSVIIWRLSALERSPITKGEGWGEINTHEFINCSNFLFFWYKKVK